MPSFVISTFVVVLHAGEALTLGEYLFRVLVYLLTFACIGVTIFWSVRAIEIVRSAISRRGGINENEL